MILHTTQTRWLEDMSFENTIDSHSFTIDASAEFGGQNRGPRPKELLLTSLAGCTGMDVVSILRKMKQNFTWFNVKVEGQLGEEHPKVYETIRVIYQFKESDNLDKAKVEKAAALSQDRYCGISAMLKKACSLRWDVEYL